jgi:VanZ family protein
MGEIRRWIRLEFPGAFVAIVGGAVGVAAAAAVGWALIRIRDRRASRYGLIALAFAIAAAYARWSALGNSDSDVVERVHFVEYGLVAWLFYRAWSPLGGSAVLVAAFLSAATVGTFEEWFQWFVPARVGEVRDVLLNSAAIVCGLLFSVAIQPLGQAVPHGRLSWRWVLWTSAIASAALAGFVDSAHIGHEIRSSTGGSFKSIYDADALRSLSSRRAIEWRATPPLDRPPRVSAEDQYASEGLLHVQARNEAWTAGDVATAWGENLILETYFAPVLDAPSYVSAAGHRWAADQRADAERRASVASPRPDAFYSHAEGAFPIFLWPRNVFRAASIALVLFLVIGALTVDRRTRG